MPERTSAIPTWAWIVGAVLVIVSIFTGYRIVQTQQHLAAAQSELESAKQGAEQAEAQVAELEQEGANLKSELQKADGQRIDLQAKLDEAGSEIERLKSELEKAPRAESP